MNLPLDTPKPDFGLRMIGQVVRIQTTVMKIDDGVVIESHNLISAGTLAAYFMVDDKITYRLEGNPAADVAHQGGTDDYAIARSVVISRDER